VLLKGSGSITAAPHRVPLINPTGNPRLGTAGTGDVLAGLAGARLASGQGAFDAAWTAAWEHGAAADAWPSGQAFTADKLARALRT
jgi:NAD(P)H-hydrate repair Nnr-like enzyme with NAD(P)H-hydrate dehydratase domain